MLHRYQSTIIWSQTFCVVGVLRYQYFWDSAPWLFGPRRNIFSGRENFIAETQSTWDWLYLWFSFWSKLHVPNCFPSLRKCRKFGPPQNGRIKASSMVYSFGQKWYFSTFVVHTDRYQSTIIWSQTFCVVGVLRFRFLRPFTKLALGLKRQIDIEKNPEWLLSKTVP